MVFFTALLMLVSCGLQKSAPLLLKGEKFYGRRDLEYIREYHLLREEVDQLSIKEEIKKIMTNKAHVDITKTQNTRPVNKAIEKFVIPVKGDVALTTPFDKICKDGVKISPLKGGMDVVASATGKVIYVGKGLRCYGNLIIIEHEDNFITMYSYLRNIRVKIGDRVEQNQVIGSASKSSIQDKNLQMCFTIKHNGQAVSVLNYINELKYIK